MLMNIALPRTKLFREHVRAQILNTLEAASKNKEHRAAITRHLLGFHYKCHLWNTYDLQIYQCSFDFFRPFYCAKNHAKTARPSTSGRWFSIMGWRWAIFFLYSNKAEISKNLWHWSFGVSSLLVTPSLDKTDYSVKKCVYNISSYEHLNFPFGITIYTRMSW